MAIYQLTWLYSLVERLFPCENIDMYFTWDISIPNESISNWIEIRIKSVCEISVSIHPYKLVYKPVNIIAENPLGLFSAFIDFTWWHTKMNTWTSNVYCTQKPNAYCKKAMWQNSAKLTDHEWYICNAVLLYKAAHPYLVQLKNGLGMNFMNFGWFNSTAIYIKITIGLTATQKPVQYVDNYLQVFFRHNLSLQS